MENEVWRPSVDELMDHMFEIEPLDRDGFLKVRETLTRMGILSVKDGEKTLTQVCHVLKKRDRYFICHFKHLFLLDGKFTRTDYADIDDARLFKVVQLLSGWNLIEPISTLETDFGAHITVVPFREKDDYILKCNYKIGKVVTNGNETTAEDSHD